MDEMLDFTFEEEDLQFLDVVREFALNEVKPAGKALDAEFDSEIFWDVWRKAARIGLIGVLVPEVYGGVGGSLTSLLLLVEELASADAGLTGSLALNWAVQSILILVGTSRQMEQYLPMISNSEAVPAGGCITEPQGGSDVESVSRCGPGALSTTYKKTGDGYLINGTKCFITNGGVAGLYVVIATSDPGAGASATSGFIVPADTPGVFPDKMEKKLGFRGSPTAAVSFSDVLIPRENLLGDEGMGMELVELAMTFNRWAVGLLAVGVARAAYEEALAYARERVQTGRPIIDHQGVGFKLADMATGIEAARSLAYKAAWTSLQFDLEPEERLKLACMAKAFCSETAFDICNEAIQVFGGYGYTNEYPVEKMMRDVRATMIFEGANGVQRADILERL